MEGASTEMSGRARVEERAKPAQIPALPATRPGVGAAFRAAARAAIALASVARANVRTSGTTGADIQRLGQAGPSSTAVAVALPAAREHAVAAARASGIETEEATSAFANTS